MAKFKVGQQVFVKGDDTPRTIEWYDPKKGYAISGEAIYYPEEDIVAANKRKKAKNAKFKVGDIVIDKSFPHSGRFRIIRVDSDEQYSIQPLRGGAITGEWEENLVRVRANSTIANAKFKVGDRVRLKGGNMLGTIVGLTYVHRDALGTVDYPGDVSVRWDSYKFDVPVKTENLTLANSVACNSRNPVVAKALNACRNARPGGLKPTSKLRLKKDFSDEYGSYKAGQIFPMYAAGGVNPKYGTMIVPGRGVTLQIPWEDLEVVNAKAAARNATEAEVAQYLSSAKTKIRDEVAFLKAVAAEMKAGTMTPAAEKTYGKVVKTMAALQKAFAELA